ncbi:arylsulfatase [Pseudomonas luteola]|uniref:aspartate/glutamate racemase family protein n=1 Tax=Pseudomonas luteola TaxID=47886 RepID=UPI000F792B90|nr:aspartate/glutamate racemase family protein [Pseudomonas luteola]RRW39905.1 arylsulfatase [Pseudomonas luteola]
MQSAKRIFLIHATQVSIEPINSVFEQQWPEVLRLNLWDDSLSIDIAASRELTPILAKRIQALAAHAFEADADAVLFTCSAFTDAMTACQKQFAKPVLKPNEAMVREAVLKGSRIAALTTFEPAVKPIIDDFEAESRLAGRSVEVVPFLCQGAMDALRAGDVARHNELIAQTAQRLEGFDVVCFAQFSMTSAAKATREVFDGEVLTTPESAVALLKKLLADR